MKKKIFFILTAAILFVISRFLYLFFRADAELLAYDKLIEGHYTGIIAKHLLEGLIMPFWDYQYSSYDGGTLICGLVIALFFWVFGPTAFAVSLYCLSNSLVIFLLWIGFVYRYWGERTAWIIAMLFIFAPPHHIKVSLMTGGNHIEINFFIILVIRCFFKIFFRPEESLRRPEKEINRDFIYLGFFAGLGVYFCYSTAVLLLVLFLFWLALDKNGFRKNNYIYLILAFLLGISFIFPRLALFHPLIKKEIFSQWNLSNFYEFIPRAGGVLLRQLPELFAITSPVYSAAYFLFVASVLIIGYSNRQSFWLLLKAFIPFKKTKVNLDHTNKNIFFVVFIVVYLVIYTVSDFNTYLLPSSPLQLRYLWLLFPFIFIITAIGIDYIFAKGGLGKKTAFLALIYVSLAGVAGLWQQLDFRDYRHKISQHFSSPGYSYEMLGTVICYRYAMSPPKSLSLLDQVEKKYLPAAYRGFGYEFNVSGYSHIEEYRRLIAERRNWEELNKGFYLGSITQKYFRNSDVDTAYTAEGVAVGACTDAETLGRRLLYYVDSFEGDETTDLYHGAGAVLAVQCELKEQSELVFLKNKNPQQNAAFVKGMAEGIDFNTRILPNL